jgi:hypothetical protein
MTRLSTKQYGFRSSVAMSIYVALMLLVWPQVRAASELPLKAILALLPVLPMLYVIWLMARRVLHSDELEQRTHLIGLGAATGASAVFSLVCGFLAAAHVFSLDTVAMILFLVFPLQMLSYGAVRAWAARRYGGDVMCEDDDGRAKALRMLSAGLLLALTACWGYWRGMEDTGVGVLTGVATALLVFGAVAWLRHGKRRVDA